MPMGELTGEEGRGDDWRAIDVSNHSINSLRSPLLEDTNG